MKSWDQVVSTVALSYDTLGGCGTKNGARGDRRSGNHSPGIL
jgi:hypothetical protein